MKWRKRILWLAAAVIGVVAYSHHWYYSHVGAPPEAFNAFDRIVVSYIVGPIRDGHVISCPLPQKQPVYNSAAEYALAKTKTGDMVILSPADAPAGMKGTKIRHEDLAKLVAKGERA